MRLSTLFAATLSLGMLLSIICGTGLAQTHRILSEQKNVSRITQSPSGASIELTATRRSFNNVTDKEQSVELACGQSSNTDCGFTLRQRVSQVGSQSTYVSESGWIKPGQAITRTFPGDRQLDFCAHAADAGGSCTSWTNLTPPLKP